MSHLWVKSSTVVAILAAGVLVPAGVFLTGPIHLKSRVELHLDGGATIDDIEFIDSTFRGIIAGEVLQQAGSVSFRNVRMEPAEKGRSLNSPVVPQ
jgi:polygalacturonase